jgi:hypothetical protein
VVEIVRDATGVLALRSTDPHRPVVSLDENRIALLLVGESPFIAILAGYAEESDRVFLEPPERGDISFATRGVWMIATAYDSLRERRLLRRRGDGSDVCLPLNAHVDACRSGEWSAYAPVVTKAGSPLDP